MVALFVFGAAASNVSAGPHLRELGLKIGPYPTGTLNTISDVKGVRVGHVTLNTGDGKLTVGKGPVRTGLTVIIPGSGDIWESKLMAGSFVLNGNGDAFGLMWLQESGLLEGPIALTNTLSLADVQKGVIAWTLKRHYEVDSLMPLVLECDDGTLNDIHGMHVKPEHVDQAIELAAEKFSEGNVGAGTGMASFDFKSGIGSSSRKVKIENAGTYTVGVLVNANIGTGTRSIFRLAGLSVATEITDLMPIERSRKEKGSGSINVIVATDMPMDSRQLNRLAKRAMNGVARLGAVAYNGSGDVAIAFSTANRIPNSPKRPGYSVKLLIDSAHNELFEAVVDATEEAVLNSLLAAKTMVGRDGNTVSALPTERVKSLLKKHALVK